MSRNVLITICSLVGVFALGCLLFVVWLSYSSNQAKIDASNGDVKKAVAAANEWVIGKSSLDGDAVEQQLVDALNNESVTEEGNGESVLTQVRNRREQLAKQIQLEMSQQQAATIFKNAKREIEAKRLEGATSLLRKYINDPHAAERGEGERLLSEAEIASSETHAFDVLVAMTDDQFNQVKSSGIINDGKVTHPVLVEIRTDTITRVFDKATSRRSENQITEQKRQEAARIAVLERQQQERVERERQEAERRVREARSPLRVFLGGELEGAQAAYYRLQPKPKLREVKKGNSGSVFDKADQPDWQSKFDVENIALAPGTLMSASVENHKDDALYGQHSEWSWTIALAVPDGVSTYRGISFDCAVGGEVDSWLFQLVGTAEMEGMTLALYKFQQEFSVANFTSHKPIDKILRRMIRGGAVKYRISTGPKGIGPVHEGQFTREVTQAIAGLLPKAMYRNRADKSPYLKDWMER